MNPVDLKNFFLKSITASETIFKESYHERIEDARDKDAAKKNFINHLQNEVDTYVRRDSKIINELHQRFLVDWENGKTPNIQWLQKVYNDDLLNEVITIGKKTKKVVDVFAIENEKDILDILAKSIAAIQVQKYIQNLPSTNTEPSGNIFRKDLSMSEVALIIILLQEEKLFFKYDGQKIGAGKFESIFGIVLDRHDSVVKKAFQKAKAILNDKSSISKEKGNSQIQQLEKILPFIDHIKQKKIRQDIVSKQADIKRRIV